MPYVPGGPSNADNTPIETVGTQVGGKGSDGKFHIFSTDALGNLNVNTSGGGGGGSAVNLTQVAGVAISEGQAVRASSLPVVIASDQSAIPISGTVAVTQSTSPWVVSGTVTVAQATASSLNATVVGIKSSNTAVPDATNLGVLGALANAASPAFTEGNLVLLSVDLTGRQRIRGTLTNNNAAPDADGTMALSALANAVAPTWTEGDLVLESVDLNGSHRVIGTRTNNAAAPSFQIGVMAAKANAAAPTVTEGFQVLLSTDLNSNLRIVQTVNTAGGYTTFSGSVGATATAIKASAGQLYGWEIGNANATTIYVQFFNLAAGSVVLGTTVPLFSLFIPAGAAANVFNVAGIPFSTAMSFATTTTRAGLTGPASTVDVNFWYT
jgi:hypothetical protein